MIFLRSLPWTFRYLEWIFITVHFGVWLSRAEHNLLTLLGFYGILFVLGWLFPCERPYWQRFSYIALGLTITVFARRVGIDLGLFLFFYISKSYFLLNRRMTIIITAFTAIPWAISEYLASVEQAQSSVEMASVSGVNSDNSLNIISTLAVYTAASFFVIMFNSMLIAEQKSRQRVEELSEQVETLAATVERTRIAREIHDSLGHTLTDLDIQLAVAQQLRFHNIEQAFEAVDTAKMLAGQCIEDVSQALARMRQSDFDLNQALTALMEQVRYNSVLQVQWEVNLPKLSVHKSYQIYCIVKEGIINVQKHACASQVSFCGRLTSEGIVLELKDNGVGFDSEKLQKGFGIQGMAERVQLLGGKLELKTALAQGTQIQILLPP
ncbi:sensor histidine kinase [Nostoc punctiforme UO1]|uniref:sensor histidine kinase n=1 Tax=Nostoc punctiforme TaxID=272131 RepID=UPI0030AF3988